jgi:hypothetical protein
MDIFGKVIEVVDNATIAKNGGGSYKGTRFTYRDSKDDGIKERSIHENVLKYNPTLKASLGEFKSGDDFTMTLEKEGEFWNIKGLVKGNKPTEVTVKQTTQGAVASPKSTYQTAEERAQTQVYIVRQSSITQAIAFFNLNEEHKVSPEKILDIAKQFEAHVFGNQEVDSGSIYDMKSDIL